MTTRRIAVLGLLSLAPARSLAAPGAVQGSTWADAAAKERYLLAQLGVSVRGWVRMEGRRQAGGPATEAAATAAVQARWPELAPRDAATLAFLVLMVAARDLDSAERAAAAPSGEAQGRRSRLGALLTAMAARTPEKASTVLRALR